MIIIEGNENCTWCGDECIYLFVVMDDREELHLCDECKDDFDQKLDYSKE